MTVPKRGRGRPRKKIRFFSDDAANDQWNAERGKVNRPPTPLALRLAEGADETDAEIKRFWRVGPYVPLDMAHRLEGIGDGPISASEEALLQKHENALRARAELGQAGGTNSKGGDPRAPLADRAAAIMRKNADLLETARRNKRSTSRVIKRILRDWKVRGDGRPKPATRTLYSWLANK